MRKQRGPVRRRLTATQAVDRVRSVKRRIAAGATVSTACTEAGLPVATFYRWRRALDLNSGLPKIGGSPDAIIAAATSVFLRSGFDATLDEIAAEAGVARQTLYNRFGSKESLFKAAVSDVHSRLMAAPMPVDDRGNLKSTLVAYGNRIAKLTLDEEAVALFRVAIGEYGEQPDLSRFAFELRQTYVLPKLTTHLADYLRNCGAGRLADGEPELLAEIFFGAVVGYDRNRILAGIKPGAPAHRRRRIEIAADAVMARLKLGSADHEIS